MRGRVISGNPLGGWSELGRFSYWSAREEGVKWCYCHLSWASNYLGPGSSWKEVELSLALGFGLPQAWVSPTEEVWEDRKRAPTGDPH